MKTTPEQINDVEGRKQYAEMPRQKREKQNMTNWVELKGATMNLPEFKFNFTPWTHIVMDQITAWCLAENQDYIKHWLCKRGEWTIEWVITESKSKQSLVNIGLR